MQAIKRFPIVKLSKVFNWVWFLPLCIAVFKLWLTSHLPILAYDSPHDQLRYVRMAWEIWDFQPPFPYDQYVLMRQPGYPAFIFLNYILGFSLRFSQELLYIVSGFFIAWSVYKYYRQKQVVILFLSLYILAPASYFANRQTFQESLYLPLTVFIISCLLHLINLHSKPQEFIRWSIALGLGMAWFWNTRPENVWILPTIASAYLLIITKAIDTGVNLRYILRQLWYSIICLIIPVLLITSLLSFITSTKYGIFHTNDLTAPGIKAAYSRLLSVSPSRWKYMVAVPKETRQEIYSVSPTFKKLSEYLENKGHTWFAYSCASQVRCDDYAPGWFIWALREAVADAGEYKSANSTEDFYRKIADEIKFACEAKTVRCSNLNFSPPAIQTKIRSEYIKPFLSSIAKLLRRLIDKTSEVNLTSGTASDILRETDYAKVTREAVTFLAERDRPLSKLKDNLIILLSTIYKFSFPILLGLAVVGLVLQQGSTFRKNDKTIGIERPIIWLMLLCVWTRILMIAWIDATSFPVLGGMRYLWPIFPIFLMLVAIGVAYANNKICFVLLNFIRDRRKINKVVV